MTIHHATLKKAASQGLTLTENEETNTVTASWDERPEVKATADNAKKALELGVKFRMAVREYPGLSVTQDGETFIFVQGENPLAEGEDFDEVFAEALEAYNQAEAGEDAGDEEKEPAGSIVKARYRAEYKARGTITHCGDWVADQFNHYAGTEKTTTRQIKGKSITSTKHVGDVEATYAFAAANGIGKQWRHLNNGQQCMNSRNMVRALVIKTGQLHVPASLNGGFGLTLEAPAEWLEAERAKRKAARPPKA